MTAVARAAIAGAASAVAYLSEQELDRRLMNPRSDDLLLLGGLVTSNPRLWRPLGLGMHLSAGAVWGMLYARLAAPRLPGPPWLRGVVAAQVENAVLWGLVPILDGFHPAVRQGALAPLTRPVYFVQQVLRHLALGVVVGALCPPPPNRR